MTANSFIDVRSSEGVRIGVALLHVPGLDVLQHGFELTTDQLRGIDHRHPPRLLRDTAEDRLLLQPRAASPFLVGNQPTDARLPAGATLNAQRH